MDFQLADYRDVDRKFDRIVSVGMLEHVGAPHLHEYFATVKRLLTDDGVALIHSIGRMDGPKVTDAFTHKYIFPGCSVPAVSEILKPVEEVGLWIIDIEVLRLDYALTLRDWRERFLADPEIPNLYDARLWQVLNGCGASTSRPSHVDKGLVAGSPVQQCWKGCSGLGS